jgi:microcystin-dependent protein
MEYYIGSVASFGFNFPPAGTHFPCDGRLLSISEYEVLYSLIGTTYGGDGVSTFAFPDLRGRVPVGTGQAPGMSNYLLGQRAGSETTTLTSQNLPIHNHGTTVTFAVNTGTANVASPSGAVLATTGFGNIYSGSTDGSTYGSVNGSVTPLTGGNQPINLVNPYQTLNYCICYAGVYPAHP